MTPRHDHQIDTLSETNTEVQPEITRLPAMCGYRADKAATVVALAEWLAPADRAVVTAVFADGKTMTEVAALLRVPPRRLMRRVRALVKRVRSPEYAFVVLHSGSWEFALRRIAGACILQGRRTTEVAAELNMSLNAVRARKAAVIAMARGAKLVADGGGAQWRGIKHANKESRSESSAPWRRSA